MHHKGEALRVYLSEFPLCFCFFVDFSSRALSWRNGVNVQRIKSKRLGLNRARATHEASRAALPERPGRVVLVCAPPALSVPCTECPYFQDTSQERGGGGKLCGKSFRSKSRVCTNGAGGRGMHLFITFSTLQWYTKRDRETRMCHDAHCTLTGSITHFTAWQLVGVFLPKTQFCCLTWKYLNILKHDR